MIRQWWIISKIGGQMQRRQKAFQALLFDQLIPDFCEHGHRGCDPSAFESGKDVSEADAGYFLRAWEAGFVRHTGRGLYVVGGRSGPREQFFWTGSKTIEPRSFRLWLEPIITVAALARLHFDFGWPKHLIGTQSADSAFDLVAFLDDSPGEHIAGEVKKTRAEVDELIALVQEFGGEPNLLAPPAGKRRNAFKKVAALRRRQPPVFWVVGPNGYNQAFDVTYEPENRLRLKATSNDILHFMGEVEPPVLTRLNFDDIREEVFRNPIMSADGNHTSRLWRIVENIEAEACFSPTGDRLLHLMSRVGSLCGPLARDLRNGFTSPEEVATILAQLGRVGEISFKKWMG